MVPPLAAGAVRVFGRFGASAQARQREWQEWVSYWRSAGGASLSARDQIRHTATAVSALGFMVAIISLPVSTALHALLEYPLAVSNFFVLFPVLYAGQMWVLGLFAPVGGGSALWRWLLGSPIELLWVAVASVLVVVFQKGA